LPSLQTRPHDRAPFGVLGAELQGFVVGGFLRVAPGGAEPALAGGQGSARILEPDLRLAIGRVLAAVGQATFSAALRDGWLSAQPCAPVRGE
jgi:hypothetical protein